MPTHALAHGWTLDQSSWARVVSALQRRHAVRVVTYDQPGHGLSTLGRGRRATVRDLGETLRAVLAEVVPDGPLVLGGHSMGGMTVMAYAGRTRRAARARPRVLLMATTPSWPPAPPDPGRRGGHGSAVRPPLGGPSCRCLATWCDGPPSAPTSPTPRPRPCHEHGPGDERAGDGPVLLRAAGPRRDRLPARLRRHPHRRPRRRARPAHARAVEPDVLRAHPRAALDVVPRAGTCSPTRPPTGWSSTSRTCSSGGRSGAHRRPDPLGRAPQREHRDDGPRPAASAAPAKTVSTCTIAAPTSASAEVRSAGLSAATAS